MQSSMEITVYQTIMVYDSQDVLLHALKNYFFTILTHKDKPFQYSQTL